MDGGEEQNVSFHSICMFAFSSSEIDTKNAEVVKFSELEMCIMNTALWIHDFFMLNLNLIVWLL